MPSIIAKALELSRQELLDIGLRGNTLLHFKPRSESLTIVDEISVEIFNILITEQKLMSFLPIPKGKENNNIEIFDQLPDLFSEDLDPKRHTDTRLQTKLNQDQLDKKLIKINTEAETYFQEQGIDILYLALGFLSWYEDDNSELERLAPLVLIPVSLNRTTAIERFKLKYTQVDLGTNLTLKAKLKTDFSIELPDFEEETDITDYFSKVNLAIKKKARWKIVENEIHLGFFKFGKFQMYQDLDSKNWPDGKAPSEHPIIQSLFGEGFHSLEDNENSETVDDLDEYVSGELKTLDNFHFISDADSSQTEAILQIKKGKNLVIQGPPGTGKSQTITNIISESLADNKKILFVSEKMVALEVVKRRLDNCQLGDCVLELHSHKSNKRAVLDELGRTIDLGKPKIDDRSVKKSRYKEIQKRLDNYCEATKQPILNSKINFVDAVGNLLRYKEAIEKYNLNDLNIESFENWSKEEFIEGAAIIKELIAYLNEHKSPSRNLFNVASIDNISPSDEKFIEGKLIEISDLIKKLKTEALKLKESIPFESMISINEVNKLKNAIDLLKTKPDLTDINCLTPDWFKKGQNISDVISNGQNTKEIYNKNSSILIDKAFDYDFTFIKKTYSIQGSKWYRFFYKDYRESRNTFKNLLKVKQPSVPESINLINEILNYQESKKAVFKSEKNLELLYGDKWKGLDSNWSELKEAYSWLNQLYEQIEKNKIPSDFPSLINTKLDPNTLFKQEEIVKSLNENLKLQVEALQKKLEIKVEEAYLEMDIDSFLNQVDNMKENLEDLFTIARYNLLCNKLNLLKLSEIAALGFDWSIPPKILLSLYEYNWHLSLVNSAYNSRDSIKYFDGIGHLNDIQEFKILDNELAFFAQEQLVLKHFNNLPNVYAPGEMALIRREINKKKRHIPIRQLLLKAGNAVQQIKPVFMMSPMSVATFLVQGAMEFDLVIFDEASQVKVVDALIPILRGKQIVVVGDSKQMPPTDFFSRTYENEEDEEENKTGDIESILGMFLAQGVNENMLKWHYRSKHDSLINVSNQEFYDGRLMVFPSSGANEKATGLKFNHFPESIYERGTSRTNPLEARKVAEKVMIHAKTNPELTLGVVAFSTAQRDCIILELERLRRQDSSSEKFFSKINLEEFFIKNLENVQGDERDVIYISIGYGRTVDKRVTSSFGPVNREGGERRLNVLITRARLAMEVFCNFTADDLATQSTTPFGVKALKSFLKYAESGVLENRFETGKETDSPFEDEVISAIKKMGYEVEPQVGSAGFFIDIAVKDPRKPGKYVLAIECDGATYHSSVSARDRDRLRQNVLEGMGWKFHRIWSTDWFRTQARQIELLKKAIEIEINQSNHTSNFVKVVKNTNKDTPVQKIATIQRNKIVHNVPTVNKYKIIKTIPNLSFYVELLEVPVSKISDYLFSILKEEGVIHITDAAKRITDSYGIGRIGNRIYEKIVQGAKYGHQNNLFFYSNEFLYHDANKIVEVRDRSELEPSFKKIENITPEEIQKALINTISMAFSLPKEEAISEALSSMGFNRATEKASTIVSAEIAKLFKEKKIKQEDNRIVIN